MSQSESPARDRVNILYKDHESKQERELPLKILVVADFMGHEDPRPIDERRPIRVDERNVAGVMAETGLRLRFNCPSKIDAEPGTSLAIDLRFRSLFDFGPEAVTQRVPELRTLVVTREVLSGLKPWFARSTSLVHRVREALAAPDNRAQLRLEFGEDASPKPGAAALTDWVCEGAGLEGDDPDAAALRAGLVAYLRARLVEFDDPPATAESAESAGSPELPELAELPQLAELAGAPPSLASLDDLLENPEIRSSTPRAERYRPEQIIVDKPGIDQLIVALDQRVSAQLDAILHHRDFQALESAWRALVYLIAHVNFRENSEIHLLNCNKQDLIDDFEDAPEIAKSGLYRLVYATEYGTFGGEPYGLVVSDYEFDPGPVDMALLANCAAVASMAHVPFIGNAAPKFFGEASFDGLATYEDVRAIFQTPAYTRWNSFRDTEDARYVALCLPRFLLRGPYDRHDVLSFTYEERTSHKDDYLWGHPSFAFATRVAESFARYRWSPNIVGPTAGGAVDGLPLLGFRSMRRTYDVDPDPSKRRDIEDRMPTEIQLTERHEFELSEEGFMGLVYLKGGDQACFFSANSCQRPKTFQNTQEGREQALGARLGAQLPYVFIVCRIAHYLKVLQREEIGRHLERSDLERELNEWLRQYVSDMDNPAPAIRGKRPLRQAHIKVEEVPGQAGWYRAHLLLRPHLKYMGASFTLSLVGKLEREN